MPRPRKWRHLAAIPFALLLGLPLLGGTRLDASQKRKERPVRLLTWNVGTINPLAVRLQRENEERVADLIAAAKPDVVTLQEIADHAQVGRIRDLVAARTGIFYAYTCAVVDPRRDDGRSCATLYRGPLRHTHVLESSVGFRALALELDGLTLVNLHGPSISFDNRQTFYRELIRWAKQLPGPVALAGDFNLGPNGGAGMAAVLPWKKKQDKQLFAEVARAFPIRTRVAPTTFYGLWLDHVMLNRGRILNQLKMLGYRKFPMDHEPLLVDLAVPVAPKESQRSRGLAGALVRSPDSE